jgi:hypothetical protein
MRGRGNNGRKNSNPRSNNYDSNGPDVKVRGNAQQVVEKYLAMARDASLADDRVAAENYFQHAEHYFRLMTANGGGADQGEKATSQPAASDNQPQNDSQSSDNEAASPEAPEAQSSASSEDVSNVDDQATPVDDPASAPQPEIGDDDSARPE